MGNSMGLILETRGSHFFILHHGSVAYGKAVVGSIFKCWRGILSAFTEALSKRPDPIFPFRSCDDIPIIESSTEVLATANYQ